MVVVQETVLLTNSIENFKWIQKNFKELEKGYEGKFIAVKNEEIIAFASTRDALNKELQKKKIDISEVFIDFIPRKGHIILF